MNKKNIRTDFSKIQLVLLDRDNTIVSVGNRRYLYGGMSIVLVPGASSFIRFWNELGVPIVVITNQQGVSLNDFPDMSLNSVVEFNQRLNNKLKIESAHIDEFYICPHLESSNCKCRKPRPGLISQALQKYSASPHKAWVIGDSLIDVQAGKNALTNTILLSKQDKRNISWPNIARNFPECLDIMLKAS